MIRVVALISDCDGYRRVRDALAQRETTLANARDAREFLQWARAEPTALVVVGLADAMTSPVQDAIRAAVDANPGARVIIACRFELAAIRAFVQLQEIRVDDVVIFDAEDTATMRDHLLPGGGDDDPIDRLRKRLAERLDPWIRPIVDWGLKRRPYEKLTVNALARSRRMRREELARMFQDNLVQPPRYLVAWLTVLRAATRLEGSTCGVERVADELGLYSGTALRRALKRTAGLTPTQMRRPCITDVGDRFLLGLPKPGSGRAVARSRRARSPTIVRHNG